MNPSTRYWLFQIPGLVAIGALSALAYTRDWLSMTSSLALLALWLLKDIVLYPLTFRSYSTQSTTGADRLIGKIATVFTPLDPHGTVRVRGETWRASTTSTSPLPKDSTVTITHVEGLTLHVTPTNPSHNE